MQTTTDEIAPDVFRISTFVPEVGPTGFTFNQFLIRADEPLLFHTGPRAMFPAVHGAAAKLIPIDSLRWITFGHVESDECGSMNKWLEAAAQATVAHGEVGCMVSLNDLADRPPRALQQGEVLDLGGKRVRHLDTPHVPHCARAPLLGSPSAFRGSDRHPSLRGSLHASRQGSGIDLERHRRAGQGSRSRLQSNLSDADYRSHDPLPGGPPTNGLGSDARLLV